MSSERAGVHTSGALNREQARELLRFYLGFVHAHEGRLLAALEACVVPDPRISDVEPLPDAIVLAVRGGIPFTYAGISFEPNR